MMLLYVCKECGHWGDMALAESIGRAMSAFSAALSNKTPEVTPQTYDCPQGHGPMVLIKPEHRLMTWDAELGLKPSMRITAVTLLEPNEPHDGNLDTHDPDADGSTHASVGLHEDHDAWRDEGKVLPMLVYLHGGHGDITESSAVLDPSQALSLLAWLEQEKATLMRLVSEQAEKQE